MVDVFKGWLCRMVSRPRPFALRKGHRRRSSHLAACIQLEERIMPAANPDAAALLQFLTTTTHRYDHSENPSDAGSPAIYMYTDFFAGGAMTNIAGPAGLPDGTFDGNDPQAARGTSSFRVTSNTANVYVEFGLANTTNSARDITESGFVRSLRFWAKGDANGQALQAKVLQKVGANPPYSFLVTQNFTLSTTWTEYVVNLPANSNRAPKDIWSVQFQLPSAGTVRLDEVRLNVDGTDPFQLIQSYIPKGWHPTNSDIATPAGRDNQIYPNRAFLYDTSLAAKVFLSSPDPAVRKLGLNQIDATLTTAPNGQSGYFTERYSGFVVLANGSPRNPASLLKTVGDNAWFGLALLDANRLTANDVYLTRAREVSDWIDGSFKVNDSFGGYLGGKDSSGATVTWRSTEHNIDVFVLNSQIAAIYKARGDSATAQVYSSRAAHAAKFVEAMFDSADGKFWTGTSSGNTINQTSIPLDALLWPSLTLALDSVYAPDLDWTRAVAYAEANLVRTDPPYTGFTFSSRSMPDRVWTEGVAHSAVVYYVTGRPADRDAALQTLRQLLSPNGGEVAASNDGLADPDLGAVYDARQATAPSAWAWFAQIGRNPFDAKLYDTTSVTSVGATEGRVSNDVTLMTFIDSNVNDTAANFKVIGATWGGRLGATQPVFRFVSDSTYVGPGTKWKVVVDGLTYAEKGTYATRFQVQDESGNNISTRNTTIVVVPDLQGPWTSSGSSLASLTQVGLSITFVDELGGTTPGGFTGVNTVNGRNGLTGTVDISTADNGRILWSDGSTWLRISLGGQYYNPSNNKLTSVIQDGTQLTFVNAAGGTSPGILLSPHQASITAWSQTATFFDGLLEFSGGSSWKKLDLSPIYRNVSGSEVQILQNGTTVLTFKNSAGQTAPGQWISPSQVSVAAWGVSGTVQNGQILWTNNTRWNKHSVVVGAASGMGRVAISIANGQLTLTNKSGGTARGRITGPGEITIPEWGVKGQLRGGQISWSNLTVWDSFDFNAIDQVFSDINSYPAY